MEKLNSKNKKIYKSGIYETIYGNACEYDQGNQAWDLDAREIISVEMVDFNKFIREFD